jgi:hypothetical protein
MAWNVKTWMILPQAPVINVIANGGNAGNAKLDAGAQLNADSATPHQTVGIMRHGWRPVQYRPLVSTGNAITLPQMFLGLLGCSMMEPVAQIS